MTELSFPGVFVEEVPTHVHSIEGVSTSTTAFSWRRKGIVIWGARTTSHEPQWQYVNVRRLFVFIQESIAHGTRWVVFEPDGPMLWVDMRPTIEMFSERFGKRARWSVRPRTKDSSSAAIERR